MCISIWYLYFSFWLTSLCIIGSTYDSGDSNRGSVTIQKGGVRREMGERFRREGRWVYLWLIFVDVWQKTTKFCEANTIQLKKQSGQKKKKKKVLWDPEDRSILGRSDIWLRAWWMNRITGYANNRKALLWRKYKESILENREDHPVTENRVWWTTTVGKPGEGSGQHWVEKDHELLAKDFILGHGAWKWFLLYNPLEVEIKIRCDGHHKNGAKHPMAQRWDRSTLNGES